MNDSKELLASLGMRHNLCKRSPPCAPGPRFACHSCLHHWSRERIAALEADLARIGQAGMEITDELGQTVRERDTALAEAKRLRDAAQCLDECLLRSFDAGMMDEAIKSGCAVDPWGSLKDFREEFGLPPTLSAEEWAKRGGQVYPPLATPQDKDAEKGEGGS